MTDSQVDAAPDKGKCVLHGSRHVADVIRTLDVLTGGANVN